MDDENQDGADELETDHQMSRTQKLRDTLNNVSWDNEVCYSKLDAIDRSSSDSTTIRVVEGSERKFNLSMVSVNWFTYFIHQPGEALTALQSSFTEIEIVKTHFRGEVFPNYYTQINVNGYRARLISSRALRPFAKAIREIEARDVGNIRRYYITPYTRLIRKNYEHFDIGYITPSNYGQYQAGEELTRVIPYEEAGNQATDW